MTEQEYTLPNRLANNTWIRTETGAMCQVKHTSHQDKYGEPLYRLFYPAHTDKKGWKHCVITGNALYSRDEFQAAGFRIV